MFNATFNNNSVISWQTVLLEYTEKTTDLSHISEISHFESVNVKLSEIDSFDTYVITFVKFVIKDGCRVEKKGFHWQTECSQIYDWLDKMEKKNYRSDVPLELFSTRIVINNFLKNFFGQCTLIPHAKRLKMLLNLMNLLV